MLLMRPPVKLPMGIVFKAVNMAHPVGCVREKLRKRDIHYCKQLAFETVAGWDAMSVPCSVQGQRRSGACVGDHSVQSLQAAWVCGYRYRRQHSHFVRSACITRSCWGCGHYFGIRCCVDSRKSMMPETYTGHGIWSRGRDCPSTVSQKTLIRIDLDENLRKAQDLQKKTR